MLLLDDILATVQESNLPALVLVESWASVTEVANFLSESLQGIPVLKCTSETSSDDLRPVISKSSIVLISIVPHIVDRLSKKQLKKSHFRSCIISEINEVLARGFRDHLQELLKDATEETTRVTLISSCPLSNESQALRKFLKNPPVKGHVLPKSETQLSLTGVDNFFINYKHHGWKVKKLLELIKTNADEPTVIICNSRRTVERLAEELQQVGIQANTVHADMNIRDRKDVVTMFLSGITQYLIATELAFGSVSGDIQNSLIINYDMPLNKDKYLSRVGVTRSTHYEGSGGKTVINFIVDEDDALLRQVERSYGVTIDEMFSNVTV